MEQKKYHLNKWASSNPKMYPVLESRAKKMRKDMTDAEKMVWELVRANRLGTKFRRQQPIGIYVADFLCVQHKLVIEVDGEIHRSRSQAPSVSRDGSVKRNQVEWDRKRDEWLAENGYKVIRITNQEVYANVDGVRELIMSCIASSNKM